MTAPLWRSQNTFNSGTGTVSTTLPTGFAADDILILAVRGEEADSGTAIATPSGWTKIGSEVVSGSGSTGSRLAVFWKRATGSETTLTIADSGANTETTMHAISGCITSGDPVNAFATTADDGTADTSLSLDGITTTEDDTLVVFVAANGSIATTAMYSSYGWPTNIISPNLKRSDNRADIGGLGTQGGGIGVWTGTMGVAGSIGGSFTATTAANTRHIGFVIALKAANLAKTSADVGSSTESQLLAQTKTDTGLGADTHSPIGVQPVTGDTGSRTETYTLAVTTSSADVGTNTQSQTIAFPGPDTGSGADSQTIAVTTSGSDTGTGVESSPSIGTTRTDTGTSSETFSIAVTLTGADTASGIDTGTIGLSDSDTGSGLDTATLSLTDTDSGLAVETQSANASLSDNDTGTGTESQTVDTGGTFLLSDVDLSTHTETFSIAATSSGADVSSSSESYTIVANTVSSDTGTDSEAVVSIAFTRSDTGASLDAKTLTASLTDLDSVFWEDDPGDDVTIIHATLPVYTDLSTHTETQNAGPINFLAAPTGLTVVVVSETGISVSWDVVPGADYYQLERDSVIINSHIAATSYSDTGLSPETTYTYRVRAIRTIA